MSNKEIVENTTEYLNSEFDCGLRAEYGEEENGEPTIAKVEQPGKGHIYIDLKAGKVDEEKTKLTGPIVEKFREVFGFHVKKEDTATPTASVSVSATPIKTAPPQNLGGFRKATRKAAKLRLGIAGPSGSGKTMSSLLIAYGITGNWEKIGLIDTENGSGELYVGAQVNGSGLVIGEYNVLTITPPYTPEKYIQGIKMAEEAGLEALIIDSLTHAWAGEGGMLDQHGKITDASKSGNSWAAWRQVTPKHNALVEKMLGSQLHIISTIRAKTEYVQEGSRVKKVGLSPVFRDGIEYEFTTFLDIGTNHEAVASKDRTNLFSHDEYFRPSPETGKKLKAWLGAV